MPFLLVFDDDEDDVEVFVDGFCFTSLQLLHNLQQRFNFVVAVRSVIVGSFRWQCTQVFESVEKCWILKFYCN